MEITGNVAILKKHLEDQGLDVELDTKTIGDEINFSQYDFIYMGSGTEKNLDAVLEDISQYKNQLNDYIHSEKLMLCTGNSFELLGKSIDEQEALGIFDYETKRNKLRDVGDIIYHSNYFNQKIVGFINKQTYMYHNMNPLFEVEFGVGENENNDYEGVKYKNFYGTHVTGPILVKNPEILNQFVEIICKNRNPNYKINKIEYQNEEEGYQLTLTELEKRRKQ